MKNFLAKAIQKSYGHSRQIMYRSPVPFSFYSGKKMEFYFSTNRAINAKPKRKDRETKYKNTDPFQPPYTPGLYISDLPSNHLLLWNRYNIVDRHCLIISKNHHEHQEELLNQENLEISYRSLSLFNSVVYYNSGKNSCASQPHRHLHLVSLPLLSSQVLEETNQKLPTRSSVFYRSNLQFHPTIMKRSHFSSLRCSQPFTLKELPFLHSCCILPKKNVNSQTLNMAYRSLLSVFTNNLEKKKQVFDLDGDQTYIHGPDLSYHLFLTKSWMMLIPRSACSYKGIRVSPLSFFGAFFVKDKDHQQKIMDFNPEFILQKLTN
ncbi:ap-4-a phosphorylase ii [Anaeramoeba flamelloides]|uniref:Ap-4-a phosphorylase ii n=1 Tax=Anaeramoeba flamelloides TaxID=1746091 RepID=A0AAV7Z7H5_9EUKA|nr:ap-4-a phosphorylase ii [Anaeramoeba flamelloides]